MIAILYAQTEQINNSKLTNLLPFLKIIALQQGLNLAKYKQFQKCLYVLKQSIINN